MSEHLARAQLLVQQERFELAERELALALAENPNDADAHRLLALSLMGRKKYDEATQSAQNAIGLEPDQPANHYVLAYIWYARNFFNRAADAIEEAVRLDPHDADCHALFSAIRLSQKRWHEALASADAALAIDSEHVDALNYRAAALRGLGQKVDAAADLQTALMHNAEDANTHANLGWNYLHQGNTKEAERHFREALRLEPGNEYARAGVLESIKARNIFYRGMLYYFFWMQTKTAGKQWLILIGAFIAYRMVFSAARSNPQWGWVLWPLVWAYIAFAVATWLAVPLANMFIWFHPFGRLALTKTEKLESLAVAVTLLLLAGLHIGAAMTGNVLLEVAALLMLVLSVSIAMTIVSRAPQARKIMIGYTCVVAILMIVMILGNVATLFPLIGYSGLGACLLANGLAMHDWRK